jgi:hypothetical protein
MSVYLSNAATEVLMAVAACSVLATLGAYLIMRCKQLVYDQGGNTNEMMSTFHELHEQGELSDEEYKNIKNRLASRMQREAKTIDPARVA